jgi:hypothetical protein
MSCCTPAGVVYLRRFLTNRHDIAVYPADALNQEEPPEHVYFYRPGELLLPADEVTEFRRVARELRFRYQELNDSPKTHVVDERSFRFDPRIPGVARFLVGGHTDIEEVIVRLERASDGRLHPTPNHVWFSCPRWQLSPHGDPTPVPLKDLEEQLGEAQGGDERGLIVAVVDGGLPQEYDHNVLLTDVGVDSPNASQEEPWLYHDPSKTLTSPDGHAAFVCGRVRLSWPSAAVKSYRALDTDGVVEQTDVISEVALALADGAQVVNLSLGGWTRNNLPPLGFGAVQNAAAEREGPILVAAAGNDDWTRPIWPAAFSWVVSVGAAQFHADGRITRANFSNSGSWVDVWANGCDVISSYEANWFQPNDPADPKVDFAGAALWSGTSFAAPHVAAILARHRAVDPALSAANAVSYLQSLPNSHVAGLGTVVR